LSYNESIKVAVVKAVADNSQRHSKIGVAAEFLTKNWHLSCIRCGNSYYLCQCLFNNATACPKRTAADCGASHGASEFMLQGEKTSL
jgi:hypothetical protein